MATWDGVAMVEDWRFPAQHEFTRDERTGLSTYVYRTVPIMHHPDWAPFAFELILLGHPQDHLRFGTFDEVAVLIDDWMDEGDPSLA